MEFYQKLAKKVNFVIILIVIFSFVFGAVSLAGWESKVDNTNIFLPEALVYENPFWAAGQNVNIKSQMKDDLYLAGLNVEVSGPIDGDVIVAGSNVVISSEIKGNLRIFGGTVIFKGKVEKNVTIAGGMITIAKEAEIGKNLIVAGGNVEMDGKINKNLYGAFGNLLVNGGVLGSAYLTIDPEGSFVLYPEANIGGNIEYTAKQTADIKTGAKIGNEEKFTAWQIEGKTPAKGKLTILFLTWWLARLLGAMVVGLILVIIFKDYTLKIQKQLDKNILMSVLKGLVYLIVTPIALVILAITLIGLPLAIILGIMFSILIYLVKIFIAVYLGEKIIRLFYKKIEISLIWSMVLGLVIIYLLCLIPYIGWLAKLFIVLWGIGVLMGIIKKDLKLENT